MQHLKPTIINFKFKNKNVEQKPTGIQEI